MYITNTHVSSIIYITSNIFHALYTLHKVRLTSSRLLQGQAASNGLTKCTPGNLALGPQSKSFE